MSDLKTVGDVQAYIRRKLGWPTVAVELTEDQIDDCINDALRLMSRHLQVFHSYAQFGVHTGSTSPTAAIEITLPDTCIGVHYVAFTLPGALINYTQTNLYEILSRMLYPDMPIGEWYMTRSFFNLYQKVRGTEPIYHYEARTNTLVIDAMSGPYDLFYVTVEEISLASVLLAGKRRYQNHFLQAALGYAKQILAGVRGKYPSIPAPGGTITTNAEVLRQEGAADIQAAETALKAQNAAWALPRIG